MRARCKNGSRQKAKKENVILSHRKFYWLLCVYVPKSRNENFNHLLWIWYQNNNNNNSADVINDYTADSRDWRARMLSRYEQLQQQRSRIWRNENYLVMIPRSEKDRLSDADRYQSTGCFLCRMHCVFFSFLQAWRVYYRTGKLAISRAKNAIRRRVIPISFICCWHSHESERKYYLIILRCNRSELNH